MSNGAHARKTELGSRPRSIGRGRLKKAERAELKSVARRLQRDGVYAKRPKTWGECQERVKGPCGWVSCRHHLFLEVDEDLGVVKLNFPDKEVDELEETCALRVAEQGGHTLDRTGELVNITLERTRQVEADALASVRRKLLVDDRVSPAARAALRRVANAMDARARAAAACLPEQPKAAP